MEVINVYQVLTGLIVMLISFFVLKSAKPGLGTLGGVFFVLGAWFALAAVTFDESWVRLFLAMIALVVGGVLLVSRVAGNGSSFLGGAAIVIGVLALFQSEPLIGLDVGDHLDGLFTNGAEFLDTIFNRATE